MMVSPQIYYSQSYYLLLLNMKNQTSSLAFLLLIFSQLIVVTPQCCSCSSLTGIASGFVALGPLSTTVGQISTAVSLSGFNLVSNSKVFSSFAIAGFKAPSNQQYFSLIVDSVIFSNGNTLMTFVTKYQYNAIKTVWTKVKLSWIAVSTAFATVDAANKMGQYIWAGSFGVNAPFSGLSGPMMQNSIFQTQTPDMESSIACGYLNTAIPSFDLTCTGFQAARFVTHLYIMGFQFNPAGGQFSLSASVLRNNGGQTVSDLDQALAPTDFVSGLPYSGPRMLINAYGNQLSYIKVGVVVTTILDIETYPTSNPAAFSYSGIYKSFSLFNEAQPIVRYDPSNPNSVMQNYHYYSLFNNKYQLFGFSSFQIAKLPSTVTSFSLDFSLTQITTIGLLQSDNGNYLSRIIVSADIWNGLVQCNSTLTSLSSFKSKIISSEPEIKDGEQSVQELSSFQDKFFIAGQSAINDLSQNVRFTSTIAFQKITPMMPYKVSINIADKAAIIPADTIITYTIKYQGNIVIDRIASTSDPATSPLNIQIEFGYLFTVADPTVTIIFNINRDTSNPAEPINIEITTSLNIYQYSLVYDPISDCCIQFCQQNSQVNLNSYNPTCTYCTGLMIYNSYLGRCMCMPGSYEIILPETGYHNCFACKTPLCSYCTKENPTFCNNCVVGAVQSAANSQCACTTGYVQSGNACICANGYYRNANQECVACSGMAGTISTGTYVQGKCNCNSTGFFSWSNSTLRCICNSGYYQNNGVCTTCKNMAGAVNTWSSTLGKCACNITRAFQWSDLFKKCICVQPLYLNASSFCMSCNGMIGALSPASSNGLACDCDTDSFFSWSSTDRKCMCSLNYFYDSTLNKCQDCSTMPGGLSTATVAGKCACDSAQFYTWSDGLNRCSCVSPYYYAVDKSCKTCKGRQLVMASASSSLGNCNCQSNSAWDIDQQVCICKNMYYMTKTITCALCKSIIGILSGNSTNGKCICDSSKYFIWDDASTSCTCLGGYFYFSSGKVCKDCTTVAGTVTNENDNGLVCTCTENMYWNSTLYACKCPLGFFPSKSGCQLCSSMTYGLKNTSSDGLSCNCNTNYNFVWNSTNTICQCKSGFYLTASNACIICSGSNTLSSSTDNKCNCIKGFEWINNKCACNDSSYLGTNKICTSCSKVYSATSDPTNGLVCTCTSGVSTWSATLAVCICTKQGDYIFQDGTCQSCSTVTKSTGVSNKFVCTCKANTEWITTLFGCYCISGYYLSSTGTCVSCTGMIGYKSANSSGTQKCNCDILNGFEWSSNDFKCLCALGSYINVKKVCASCLSLPGSTGESDGQKCFCFVDNSISWNSKTIACNCSTTSYIDNTTLDAQVCNLCSTLSYGTTSAKNSNGISCNCNTASNFVWNGALLACACKTGFYLTSTKSCFTCTGKQNLGTGAANPNQCICKANYLWDSLTASCKLITISGKAASCKYSFIFVWDQIKNEGKCVCPTNHIDKNGICLSCVQVDYSTGLSLNSVSCECLTGLIWSKSHFSCGCGDNKVIITERSEFKCLECSSLNHAIRKVNDFECQCEQSFAWSGQKCECLSQFIYDQESNSCIKKK